MKEENKVKTNLGKRILSIFFALVMVVSMVPLTASATKGKTSYKNKTITLFEYTSTGSRKKAGSSTGGSVTLKSLNDNGTYGTASFNNSSFELLSPAFFHPTTAVFHIYNSGGPFGKSIAFTIEETDEIRASLHYTSSDDISFANIIKMDSLNLPPAAGGHNEIIYRTYFKRSSGGLSAGNISGDSYASNTKKGTYCVSNKDGVCIRSGPGENYPILAYLSSSTTDVVLDSMEAFSLDDSGIMMTTDSVGSAATVIKQGELIGITEIRNGWGHTTYRGVTGWVNMYYLTYHGVLITKPVPPTVKLDTSPDIPVTGTITVSWNSVYDAKYYKACLYNSAGQEVKAYGDLYGTTATFSPQEEGVYTVKVYAQNSMYTSDPGVLAQAITAHGKSKVKYLNWDDTKLGTQDVSYKNNSVAPIAPEREGYTFYRWSDSIENITAEKTVKAEYRINEYPVMFFDKDGKQIGSTQYVKYHESATEPEAPELSGYIFSGWSSDDWKNVYKENKNEPIKIYPIYVWENSELPVTCNITEASRQPDGYYVKFDIENHVNKITRGRAVVCLKTDSGKLVYTTESSAFSIPELGSETGMKVFVPCDDAATKAEVIILDSFEKSIPISEAVTSGINQGKMWSDWILYEPTQAAEAEVDALAVQNGWDIVKEDVYKYKTRTTATNNHPVKVGWTRQKNASGTNLAGVPFVGNWSAWTDSIIDPYEYKYEGETYLKREIQDPPRQVNVYANRTIFDYFHYKNWSTGRWSPVVYKGFSNQRHESSYTYSLSWQGNSDVSGWSYYKGGNACWHGGNCGNGGGYWYPNGSHSESYVSGQKTQYSYRDTTYTFHFEKWSDWSDWSNTPITSNADRQVEHMKRYRYKSQAASQVNDSGEIYNIGGTLDPSLAGKLINLYVVKYEANSDFTNEYVGQSVIGSDGSYSFSVKLREEPSEKTGDMTAYIGIQGTEEMQNVAVPDDFDVKMKYTINFYDSEDSVEPFNTQEVEEGGSASMPELPEEKPGYIFAGWNNTCTNVRSDMEVRPIFVEKQLVVQYIDPRNEEHNKVELCTYGTPLEVEDTSTWDLEDTPSGIPIGWDITVANDVHHENEATVVEDNMVVYAQYETKQLDVSFAGVGGEILDNVQVEYDGFVEMPELPEQDGVEFLGWDIDEEDLAEVKDSITVNAIYVFDETTATPEISLESGAYEGTQTVTITCATDNSVIFYTLDGSDPNPFENENAMEYEGPITISESCILTCYAGSVNANDSETEQAMYVIDGNGKIVTIKNYQDSETDISFLVDNVSDVDPEEITEYGSVFEGFFYDSEFTQPVDVNNDSFGSVVTLYAKFSLDTYTVTFKDNNGGTVQSTTAEYGTSVTPPEMNNIGDLVFLGWEGGDYEFVSEDTVLTPIYKHKDEIVNIELNRYNYTLEEGFTFRLEATVTPEEKSDLMVIWISDDDSIASVLDDGTVTANKAGETTIYAVTEDDSAIAECKVTVSKSPNLSLCFKETATIGLDTAGNLRGIPLKGNTVDFVASQLRNTKSSLKFVKADGTVLTGENKVGTGTKVLLMDGGRELDSLTIVLTGDVDGNGQVNVPDVSKVARFVVGKETPDALQNVAADVNGDGKVNNRDAAYLLRYTVGKETINTAL